LLLQQAKLIELKDPIIISALKRYYSESENLKFIEVEGPQTARAIDDVDLAFGYPHYLRLAKTADPESALCLMIIPINVMRFYLWCVMIIRTKTTNYRNLSRFIKLAKS
jgi:ABC-type metal ion transport system substrate-binding protein